MDPVSAAVLAAVSAGAASAGPKIVEKAVGDAYEFLKKDNPEQIGANSELSQAVAEVEKRPDSHGRKTTLKDEVAKVRAATDPELLQAATEILDALGERQQIHISPGD